MPVRGADRRRCLTIWGVRHAGARRGHRPGPGLTCQERVSLVCGLVLHVVLTVTLREGLNASVKLESRLFSGAESCAFIKHKSFVQFVGYGTVRLHLRLIYIKCCVAFFLCKMYELIKSAIEGYTAKL